MKSAAAALGHGRCGLHFASKFMQELVPGLQSDMIVNFITGVIRVNRVKVPLFAGFIWAPLALF
ncbi:MAG: hypothetical protein CMM07_13640 [Rhodopirellula sp.]|nr:hypothetical protein [Rhodopirellula sp.]